ncbi:TetR family transcriptional regulator, partial [Brevibacterium paucivorans]
ELLVGISKRLHAGMSSIVAAHSGAQPREAMEDLLAF